MLNGNCADLEKIPIIIKMNGISKLIKDDEVREFIFSMLNVPVRENIKTMPPKKNKSPNLVIQKAIVEDFIASESLFQNPIKK
tara:strand:+ start:962 stop:1210 length:249 start_codon:yes stop_codon:yes gene_type:complete